MAKINLGLKIFQIKKSLAPEKNLVQKQILGSKKFKIKNFGKKEFLVKKMFGKTILELKKKIVKRPACD